VTENLLRGIASVLLALAVLIFGFAYQGLRARRDEQAKTAAQYGLSPMVQRNVGLTDLFKFGELDGETRATEYAGLIAVAAAAVFGAGSMTITLSRRAKKRAQSQASPVSQGSLETTTRSPQQQQSQTSPEAGSVAHKKEQQGDSSPNAPAVEADIPPLSNQELLSVLADNPGVAFEKGRSPVRSVVYFALGGLIIAVAAVAGILGLAIAKRAGGASAVGFDAILVMGIASLGTKLVVRGRQLRPADARRLLEKDSRQPVIYLRSFEHDVQPTTTHVNVAGVGAVTLSSTSEEDLARVMKRVGPFLAIGSPSEPLPTLGAARLYVDDAHWQSVVRQLVASARLVIIRAAATAGLTWELKQVVRRVPAQKTLLFVSGDYKAFCEIANSVLPVKLPPEIGHSRFISFGPDWSPRVVPWRHGPFDLGSASTMRKELSKFLVSVGVPKMTFLRKLLQLLLTLGLLVLFFFAVIWLVVRTVAN
jgi:hypothetical protein